jgi:hypothetical protein
VGNSGLVGECDAVLCSLLEAVQDPSGLVLLRTPLSLTSTSITSGDYNYVLCSLLFYQ